MKIKIVYIAILLCLAGLAMAADYTDIQKSAIDGLNWGFKMGQAYQLALDGKDISGFNAKVDEYNAWVRANFGEDPNLLMDKMEAKAQIDLSKPVLIANNTTSSKGIVHEMDGSSGERTITTNDVNLLSDAAIAKYRQSEEGKTMGAEYLSGV